MLTLLQLLGSVFLSFYSASVQPTTMVPTVTRCVQLYQSCSGDTEAIEAKDNSQLLSGYLTHKRLVSHMHILFSLSPPLSLLLPRHSTSYGSRTVQPLRLGSASDGSLFFQPLDIDDVALAEVKQEVGANNLITFRLLLAT